jgi:MoaA/NifB/PqqE/SkfB family radical SAM enzyme
MVIELTNRCNLRCYHCFAERHAGIGALPPAIIAKILRERRDYGIDLLAFTGGEPTIHRQFETIIAQVCEAGYTFSLVSNGATFPHTYPLLLRHRQSFTGVTFSLDSSREATHDRLRGTGSYRRVLRAASICVIKELPCTLNMVLTTQNRHEVAEMVELPSRLGSRGVRFGHLMPSPDTAQRQLDLSPHERREVEAESWQLQSASPVPVSMAPGYYSDSSFFPCAPLTLQEYNLDYRGNLTLCCQLSGTSGVNAGTEIMGNLYEISLVEVRARFHQRVATYPADKQERVRRGKLSALDHFPCWYCVRYLDKIPWLKHFAQHPWAREQSHPVVRGGPSHSRIEVSIPP